MRWRIGMGEIDLAELRQEAAAHLSMRLTAMHGRRSKRWTNKDRWAVEMLLAAMDGGHGLRDDETWVGYVCRRIDEVFEDVRLEAERLGLLQPEQCEVGFDLLTRCEELKRAWRRIATDDDYA